MTKCIIVKNRQSPPITTNVKRISDVRQCANITATSEEGSEIE